MNTKDYTKKEFPTLIEWIERNRWLLDHIIMISKNNYADICDVDCKLKTDYGQKELFVEIKNEESTFASETKNITFDAISVCYVKPEYEKIEKYNWFTYKEIKKYFNIKKLGNMFDTKPDIILKKIGDSSLILSYNNHILTSEHFINYIKENYKCKINPKKKYGLTDSWESGFFAIPIADKKLMDALILNERQFKALYNVQNAT